MEVGRARAISYFLNVCGVLSFLLVGAGHARSEESVDMGEVRRLAREPVASILADTPVKPLDPGNYRGMLGAEHRPVIVFFYSDVDGESQRLATLLRYLAPLYSDRISFYRVQVAVQGKPAAAKARELKRRYRLKSTPGVLFYDNPGSRLKVVQEEYINPDFKEFRSPRMFYWRTYYRVVQRELDKLLEPRT